MKHKPLTCPNCKKQLKKVGYTMYGAKVFNPKTGAYEESHAWGDEEMEILCPHCDFDLGGETTEEFTNRLIG